MIKKLNFSYKSVLALIISIIHAIPLYITMVASLKSRRDFSSRWLLPKEIEWSNFSEAFKKADLGQSLLNNIVITFSVIAVVVVLGGMAAYPLSRNKTKINNLVLLFFLSVMMIPALTIIVPLIRLMNQLGGMSRLWGLVVVLSTYQLPLSIFLYKNFIDAIPRSLDEAAIIDGCSPFQSFRYIILPLLKPVTATVVILTGISTWNDYQFSVFLVHSKVVRNTTLAVASFFGQQSSNLNLAAAAAIIVILPTTILFLFLQKYFVQGMVDSAVK